MKIHQIVDDQPQFQPVVDELHIRHQRIIKVIAPDLPSLRNPTETAVHPDAEPKGFAPGVVLLADMRKIKIPDAVFLVKGHQQMSVSDGQIARHNVISRGG